MHCLGLSVLHTLLASHSVTPITEALHCTPKSAMQEMRRRNVELIATGKSYVVYKENFYNAFRGEQ